MAHRSAYSTDYRDCWRTWVDDFRFTVNLEWRSTLNEVLSPASVSHADCYSARKTGRVVAKSAVGLLQHLAKTEFSLYFEYSVITGTCVSATCNLACLWNEANNRGLVYLQWKSIRMIISAISLLASFLLTPWLTSQLSHRHLYSWRCSLKGHLTAYGKAARQCCLLWRCCVAVSPDKKPQVGEVTLVTCNVCVLEILLIIKR